MNASAYFYVFEGVLRREFSRFFLQKARLFSSLVRPLLWLVVFAAGFRSALGLAIIPPYQSYITYPVYITPGLVGIIILFNSMQSSLSMVYDREMGSMKVLMTSPVPRSFLLISKLLANAFISLVQVLAFLTIAYCSGVDLPLLGFVLAIPAILLTSIMLGSVGLLLSSFIKQLENFAGVMNFVIFPMFFLSSALYPLWKMKESNEIVYYLCLYNPFTYVVELIRFSLYSKFNFSAFLIVILGTLVFLSLAVYSYQTKSSATKPR